VAEGVRDPPEAPAVLLVHRPVTVAPAAAARSTSTSGSSTTSSMRVVGPGIDSGLKWRNAGVSSETQNDVLATDSWATIASSPTRYSSTAPNAAL
jgi:hypothetical protein